MSDVIGGAIRAGLALTAFDEHPHDISNVFGALAPLAKLPMSYTLVARRPAS